VQCRDPAGLLLLQPDAEQVGEQVVVAPPAAHLIQRHQEQAGQLDHFQHRLAIGPAGDRIAQLPAEALQHRGLQQEPAHLLALALEHLPGQVVQDVAVAAAERRHKSRHIRLSRSDRAASCSPAAQPSVRAVSAATAGRAGPRQPLRAAARPPPPR
jgi:hypothetical protein